MYEDYSWIKKFVEVERSSLKICLTSPCYILSCHVYDIIRISDNQVFIVGLAVMSALDMDYRWRQISYVRPTQQKPIFSFETSVYQQCMEGG